MKGAKKTISTDNNNSIAKKRKLELAKYRTFRLSKPIKSPKPPLPSSWQILKKAIQTAKTNRRFFFVFTGLYGILTYFFIKAVNGGLSVVDMRAALSGSIDGSLGSSLAVFGVLLGNSTQVKDQSVGIYQAIILIVFSMAIIYGLRNMLGTRKKITVKESFYKGMTALVPFILVLIVIGLQLLPLSFGSSIYANVVGSGLAVTDIERFFWVLFVASLGLLTVYMLISSIFALYIVTLPNMTPMKALRASRELVRHRRLSIFRKFIFLLLAILIVLGVLIVPLIAYLPAVADVIFFLASIAVLPFVHTYIYTLYRKML